MDKYADPVLMESIVFRGAARGKHSMQAGARHGAALRPKQAVWRLCSRLLFAMWRKNQLNQAFPILWSEQGSFQKTTQIKVWKHKTPQPGIVTPMLGRLQPPAAVCGWQNAFAIYYSPISRNESPKSSISALKSALKRPQPALLSAWTPAILLLRSAFLASKSAILLR